MSREVITLTPEQRNLARHALGLPNDNNISSRTGSVIIGPWSKDHQKWLDMVTVGAATRTEGKAFGTASKPFGGDDIFILTRAGAEAALEPGERLCPEDFPS